MTEKMDFQETKREISFACNRIPLSFSSKKRDFEIAVDCYNDAVQHVEEAMSQYLGREQSESYSKWQDLLCMASFGQGLSEGLLGMKNKTYRNRYRSFRELELIVSELNNACAAMRSEPKLPENHLRIGKGFGRLGLSKEGQNMLAKWSYWDNIDECLAQR